MVKSLSKIKTAIYLLKNNPEAIYRAIDSNLSRLRFLHVMPDSIYLRIRYYLCVRKKLNLDNPVTFNEKLQWLKIYYRNPLYVELADKFRVKKYINKNYPDLRTIPTLGLWKNAEDIDFERLPDRFVLKCTHDTGSVIICDNKKQLNKEYAKKKLNKALKNNLFYQGREWIYKSILPQVIAEEYLENNDSCELIDYKFMCFNGVVKCCFVCSDRFSEEGLHVTFFDREWNMMPFCRHYPRKESGIQKPDCYETMIRMAESMSSEMPFVRIDFYVVNGEIYFGEYTFFPGSGLEEFNPDEWDEILGNWLILPERNN